MNIKFVDLYAQYLSIKEDIDAAIEGVIKNSSFIGGSPVRSFEEQFSSLYGIKHCISVANGTDSLFILMKMMGIGAGDEVITVANSWISSSETISLTGAIPVFVDIDPDYYSMDENKFEQKINSNTRAVVAVHLQGQMLEIKKIKQLCDKHSIILIEDCAQSHFSEYDGKRAGTFGMAASFSFYPGKNLGAYGDAGCIMTNDDQLAEKCRMFANHGALKKHQHLIEGINSRLDGMQAAILSAKLPHILKWTEARINKATYYTRRLNELCPDIVTPKIRPGTKHSFHLYVIRASDRDALKSFLETRGIETAVHYPTILPALPAYSYLNDKGENYPVAYSYQKQILSLPLYPEISETEIDYVIENIAAFYQKGSINALSNPGKLALLGKQNN